MAASVTTQVLLDGSLNTIIKVTILGDGTGELTKQIIYDSSAYVNDTQNNKLWKISYTLDGFSGTLYWDATSDVQMMSLAPDHPAERCFYDEGGLPNAGGSGRTGDILLSTDGLAALAAGTGEIILYIKKKNA